MQKRQATYIALGAAILPWLVLPLRAQEALGPVTTANPAKVTPATYRGERGLSGFQNRLEKAVGLSPEQKDAVRSLLAQQRTDIRAANEARDGKAAAIRQQTDAKIRALLNPDQQKKFDSFISKQKQTAAAKPRRAP